MSEPGALTPHISPDERLSRLSGRTMSFQELWGVECQKLEGMQRHPLGGLLFHGELNKDERE